MKSWYYRVFFPIFFPDNRTVQMLGFYVSPYKAVAGTRKLLTTRTRSTCSELRVQGKQKEAPELASFAHFLHHTLSPPQHLTSAGTVFKRSKWHGHDNSKSWLFTSGQREMCHKHDRVELFLGHSGVSQGLFWAAVSYLNAGLNSFTLWTQGCALRLNHKSLYSVEGQENNLNSDMKPPMSVQRLL